jgi:hypothetical protein
MSASWAVATIAATQTAEAKKKKRKRDGPTVSSDTTTVSSGVETINVEEEEDVKSPDMATVPHAETPPKVAATEERVMETPRRAVAAVERSWSGADVLGEVGSQKRVRRAPHKPIKPGLRSASK